MITKPMLLAAVGCGVAGPGEGMSTGDPLGDLTAYVDVERAELMEHAQAVRAAVDLRSVADEEVRHAEAMAAHVDGMKRAMAGLEGCGARGAEAEVASLDTMTNDVTDECQAHATAMAEAADWEVADPEEERYQAAIGRLLDHLATMSARLGSEGTRRECPPEE